MTQALGVRHGQFGRACLYRMNKPLATHAHREGHLTFLVQGVPFRQKIVDDIFNGCGVEAVAINPHDADNHAMRGLVLHRMDRHEEALAAVDTGLAIDPEHVGKDDLFVMFFAGHGTTRKVGDRELATDERDVDGRGIDRLIAVKSWLHVITAFRCGGSIEPISLADAKSNCLTQVCWHVRGLPDSTVSL